MPEPSTPDCEHGYRAAGGTYACPVCEVPMPDRADAWKAYAESLDPDAEPSTAVGLRSAAERHQAALRHIIGGQLVGFDVKDDQVVLRFGRGRELIVESHNGVFQVHYCGPVA